MKKRYEDGTNEILEDAKRRHVIGFNLGKYCQTVCSFNILDNNYLLRI
jgi:hypothetical protein